MPDRYGRDERHRDENRSIGFSEVRDRTFDADWRGRSTLRDYSGIGYGLSGGHADDASVHGGGMDLEAGYLGYGRPDYLLDQHGGSGWRIRGPHTGRGPRGYRRSDERIREEINDRLTAHGWIDAMDIECTVRDAEVTLQGLVNSRSEKRAAEDVADAVPGVRDVHNHLRIRRSGPEQGVGRTNVLGIAQARTRTRRAP